jgi:hypothetical protein
MGGQGKKYGDKSDVQKVFEKGKIGESNKKSTNERGVLNDKRV